MASISAKTPSAILFIKAWALSSLAFTSFILSYSYFNIIYIVSYYCLRSSFFSFSLALIFSASFLWFSSIIFAKYSFSYFFFSTFINLSSSSSSKCFWTNFFSPSKFSRASFLRWCYVFFNYISLDSFSFIIFSRIYRYFSASFASTNFKCSSYAKS